MKSEEVRNTNLVTDRLLRRTYPTPAKKNQAEYIRENVRKLGLWNSRTLKPIITHDELGIIMCILGFVGLAPCPGPGGTWKEYMHSSEGVRAGEELGVVRPKLPFPRVDGLHMATYASFFDSVNLYVRMDNIADVFHIRAMPLHRIYDRNERWRRMDDNEYSVFLYRNETLDQPLLSFCMSDCQNELLGANSEYVNSMLIHENGTSSTACLVVPLEDIIVRPLPVLSFKLENDEVNIDTKA